MKARVITGRFGWKYLDIEGVKEDIEISAVVATYIKELQNKIKKLEDEGTELSKNEEKPQK